MKKYFSVALRLTVITLCLSLFIPFSIQASTKMPSFSLESIQEGGLVSSEQLENKALFLAFFATWCPPCRVETPSLVKLQDKFSDRGFSVIGMSMDLGKKKEVVKFIEEFSINYPVLMTDREVIQEFGGVYTIPTAFLIDKKGNVVKMYTGVVSYATLVKDIRSILE